MAMIISMPKSEVLYPIILACLHLYCPGRWIFHCSHTMLRQLVI